MPETSHPKPVRDASYNSAERAPLTRKAQQPVKINNHYIAPKKKGLEGLVRDHSKITLEVFERNLAKRKGYTLAQNAKIKGQKNFLKQNMVPHNRKMKITQSSKDIVLDSYQPYNRYSDPHLAKYLGRKTKIAHNKKDAIKKDEYYANGM